MTQQSHTKADSIYYVKYSPLLLNGPFVLVPSNSMKNFMFEYLLESSSNVAFWFSFFAFIMC